MGLAQELLLPLLFQGPFLREQLELEAKLDAKTDITSWNDMMLV